MYLLQAIFNLIINKVSPKVKEITPGVQVSYCTAIPAA